MHSALDALCIMDPRYLPIARTSGEKIQEVFRDCIERELDLAGRPPETYIPKVLTSSSRAGTETLVPRLVPRQFTPPREAIARKTTLMANHLVLFIIVIYPSPGVSIRVRKDANRNERLGRKKAPEENTRNSQLSIPASRSCSLCEKTSSKKQSLMDHRGLSRISLSPLSSFALSGGHFVEKCPTSFDFHSKILGKP